MLLVELVALLDETILNAIPLQIIVDFVQISDHLRPRLQWMSMDMRSAPTDLIEPLPSVIAEVLAIPTSVVQHLWSTLRQHIWDLPHLPVQVLRDRYGVLNRLVTVGLKYDVGFYDLFPPTSSCLDNDCRLSSGHTRHLTKPLSYKITIFSRELGPLPAWCYSLACPNCNTRYYPTYYVHAGRGRRTYYPYQNLHEIHVIEVAKHYYLEMLLIDRFTNMAACSWVSSTNNAKIYNLEHEITSAKLSSTWSFASEMTSDMAMDGLLLLGLLADCIERRVVLDLHDNALENHDRLRPALEARTSRMVGPGQEHWNHACTLCCEVNTEEQKAIRAVVTDGIDMGHACCGVHDCKTPLSSQRDRFCAAHSAQSLICAVIDCTTPAVHPYKTCAEPLHRDLENQGDETRTALFQLKRRLEKPKAAHPHDTLTSMPPDDEPVLVDCPDKPEAGNQSTKRICIHLGRSFTHNEELCVACCGMILGRATFFGSEAPNAVRIFHRRLFPTRASLPSVIFYDNNCHVKQVIDNLGDTHFDGVALPVDVFHMKTKHKVSDKNLTCSTYCNPANFPDLYANKKWRFNSSAAEVTNAWFGGFRSVVREMRQDRYNFFLDEMIKRRNRFLSRELEKRHARPYSIPRMELLG